MHKLVLAMLALVGALQPALSADLRQPAYKVPPPIVPPWSWTGCYAGAHGGWLRASKKDWTVRTPGGAFFGESLGGHDADSWIAGAQAGCDYQAVGGFVVGLQGDHAWTSAEGRHDSAREIGVAYHSKVTSLTTVTGRIGYAWDRLLVYGGGGLAWERDEYRATTIVLGTAYKARATQPGWTIRAGGEYAFTHALSGFVEYNYYNFGTRQIAFTPQVPGLNPAFVDITESKSVVRAGLNIRFHGFGTPDAAGR